MKKKPTKKKQIGTKNKQYSRKGVLLTDFLCLPLFIGAAVGATFATMWACNRQINVISSVKDKKWFKYQSNSDVVEGFSDYALANTDKVADGTEIIIQSDISGDEGIFSAEVQGDIRINKLWEHVGKLDLSGARFLNTMGSNTHVVNSGFNTFKYVNFAKLNELSLEAADFSTSTPNSTTAYYTASGTFAYAYFPLLVNINLKQTKFARESTNSSQTVANGDIHTGYGTFSHAHFGLLSGCDLSKTIFAAPGMVGNGNIFTADSTFAYASFNIKEKFNFAAVYASANMIGSTDTVVNTQISTGFRTFESTDFAHLEKFILKDVKFAASNMGKVSPLSPPLGIRQSTINTGDLTFYGAMFPSASEFSISNVDFAATNMIKNGQLRADEDAVHMTVNTGNCTFQDLHVGAALENATSFNMSNITFAAENMVTLAESGSYDEIVVDINTAFATFRGMLSYADQLTIPSNVFFATPDMDSTKTSNIYNGGTMRTGDRTFQNVIFNDLTVLDLTNTSFAAKKSMTGYKENKVYVGSQTFESAEFLNLKPGTQEQPAQGLKMGNLIKGNTQSNGVFCMKEDQQSPSPIVGFYCPAFRTFFNAQFPTLKYLDLSTCSFSAPPPDTTLPLGVPPGEQCGASVFQNASFSNLEYIYFGDDYHNCLANNFQKDSFQHMSLGNQFGHLTGTGSYPFSSIGSDWSIRNWRWNS